MRALIACALAITACSSEEAPKKTPSPAPVPAAAAAVNASGEQLVTITVTEEGYVPKKVEVAKGRPVHMVVTRKTDATCATEVVLPEHQIDVKLPLGTPVDIVFTPTKSGELVYGCAMDHMISSVILVK